jgi:hypothetical protein
MSVRAINEARTFTEAYSVKRGNSFGMEYRKKKVSFSNIINVRILYPDDVDKSDTLTTVQLTNRLTPESLSEDVQPNVPIIARDIKKKQLKEDITIDTIYLSDVSAIKFARNLVDVILKHANSCQTDMVYLP